MLQRIPASKNEVKMNSPVGTSRIRFVLWTCVVTWMAVIFFLSAQEASQSSSLSGSAIWSVAEIAQPGFREMSRDEQESIVGKYQYIARKAAHMIAYLALGVFCMTALFQYAIKRGLRAVTAFAVCVGYAGTDEIHQLFVAGRSGQITDVGIDAFGVSLGICSVMFVHWAWKTKRAKTQNGTGGFSK